jgi:sulfur-carrier protein
MSVKVHFFSSFQPYVQNQAYIETTGLTIGDCLKNIIKKYPDIKRELFFSNGRLRKQIGIYLNGQNAYPNELARPVKEEDEIYIMWVLAGG